MNMSVLSRILLLSALLPILSGCNSVAYLSQAAGGQLDLINRRQPIAELIEKDTTPAALKASLRQVLEMREFASRELGLPDNGSYKSYADIGRPFTTWNVVAAPRLSTKPKTWCFPISGCVAYRGYFAEADARDFAESLKSEEMDVHIGGSIAYSTLGWFDDPVLNTMLDRPPAAIAGVLFHELAHQRLYIKNDTAFNESFATVVELAGVKRWLAAHAGNEKFQNYRAGLERRDRFTQLVMKARDELQAVYDSDASDAEKLKAKQQTFVDLRQRYAALKKQWGGYAGYDKWMDEGLNNARLASVGNYYTYVPHLTRLLEKSNGDMEAFYSAAEGLGKLDPAARKQALEQLLRG